MKTVRLTTAEAIVRWLVALALVAIPFVTLGRRLSAGLAPRTYRYAP